MKIKELRQKKVGDLHKLLKSNREELRSLRFSISSEQEKNVRKIRDVKKDIAKILTILNNNQETEKQKLESKDSENKEVLPKENLRKVEKKIKKEVKKDK